MSSNFTIAVALSDYLPSDQVRYTTFVANDLLRIRSIGPPDGWSVVRCIYLYVPAFDFFI